ncbi:MAG: prepilin-type N-terminal cleavage/methylation domain-containing protein [Candidatus Eremiobacterota bacterium]
MVRIIKKAKGFTLLEIMIAIGIITVLMSVLIPSFQRARSQAKLAVCIETIKNVATAVETYAMERGNQRPPATLAALVPGYLKVVPIEPVSLTKYSYQVSTLADKNFTISCPGPKVNHKELGIPINHPLYSPATGQEKGIEL